MMSPFVSIVRGRQKAAIPAREGQAQRGKVERGSPAGVSPAPTSGRSRVEHAFNTTAATVTMESSGTTESSVSRPRRRLCARTSQSPRTDVRDRAMPSSSKRYRRMRCTTAASPATHTRRRQRPRPTGRGHQRIAQRHAGGQVAPLHLRSRVAGQLDACVGMRHLDANIDRGVHGNRLEQLADRRDRGLVAADQDRAVGATACRGPDRRSRPGLPVAAALAHTDALPPSCTTMSRSSSNSDASTRRGVNVLRFGRRPPASRNSLPFHTGIARSRSPPRR